MTANEALTNLFSEFQDHWDANTPASAHLAFEDIEFEPRGIAKGNRWCEVLAHHLPGGGQAALGVRLFRRLGMMQVQCFSRVGKGAADAHRLGEFCLSYFQQGSSHVRFISQELVSIGSDGFGWYQVNAQSGFSYDVTED